MIEDFPQWTGPAWDAVIGLPLVLWLVSAVIALGVVCSWDPLHGSLGLDGPDAKFVKAMGRTSWAMFIGGFVVGGIAFGFTYSAHDRAAERFVQAAADLGYLVSPASIDGDKPDARFDAIDPDGALVHCTSDIDYAPGKHRLHCTAHTEQPISTADHDATVEEIIHAIDTNLVVRAPEPRDDSWFPWSDNALTAAEPDGTERTFRLYPGSFGPEEIRLVFE